MGTELNLLNTRGGEITTPSLRGHRQDVFHGIRPLKGEWVQPLILKIIGRKSIMLWGQ